jgi:short-subunit dehydrogenase
MKLAGKNVWVIGASMGIGNALADALQKKGANLLLSSRSTDLLKALASRLELSPERVLPFDITDTGTVAETVRKAIDIMGGIDAVVFTAGVSQRSMVAQTRIGVYRDLINLNFLSIVDVTLALLPHMLARRSGHIVVLSSLAGKFGSGNRSGYCASKHALHGFFDSLRAEHRKDNIDVTLVCPGYIRTAITLRSLTGDGSPHNKVDEELLKGMPVDRCANQIIKAIEQRRREIYPGGSETLGVYLNRFFPGFFAWLVSRLTT